jgi:hypothetical protein
MRGQNAQHTGRVPGAKSPVAGTGAADESSVALKWSDGVFDSPPLGAHIYLEPHMDGKSVRLRVYFGRERTQFFMPGRNGEIDVVRDAQQASSKWSNILWRSDGLHVGVDGNRTRYFVPHKQIKPIN